MRRLRALSEAECYARCYGAGDPAVRAVRQEPPVRAVRLSAAWVRRLFEEQVDARAAEAA